MELLVNFSMRYCFRWKDSGKHVRPFQKTRTTFFKNMYVFSQKDYPVFLMLIFNALCISFSCELIVRNFTWDPCIPYIPAWLKWIVTENMLSLFPNRFRIYHSGMWIKRESGVNPGQSRCCEAPKNILKQHYRHWF